ncbi:MAG: ArgE/DapE family deacylase [Thermomicrobiales bacterium]|nr:ArgE/DapE family deacylase [Thermomicrobiales bacterium]
MTAPTDQQVIDAVDRIAPRAIALLQALVRTPSLTGDEGAVQQLVAAAMTEIGLDVDVWDPSAEELAPYSEHVGAFDTLAGRPNVVGRWGGSGGGTSLILNGHIDTVEPGVRDQWVVDPFSAEILDGRVFGRGSLDMKSGVVSNIIAVAALREIGWQPKGDLIVESVISEEDGGAGALASILRGYTADACIITEPTAFSIVVAQGGSLVFRIHVPGKSAHGAARNEGISAFELFIPIFQALLDFEAERNRTIDHPLYAEIENKIPINVGVIRSGAWPSSVPDWLIAEGRAGLVPGETLEQFKAEFIEVVMNAASRDPWLAEHPPRVEWFSGQFAPSEISAGHELVDAVSAAHRAVTGDTPSIKGVTYGADMRHFINIAGIPCVMYGADDVSGAHAPNESVAIADMLTCAKAVAIAARDWCS